MQFYKWHFWRGPRTFSGSHLKFKYLHNIINCIVQFLRISLNNLPSSQSHVPDSIFSPFIPTVWCPMKPTQQRTSQNATCIKSKDLAYLCHNIRKSGTVLNPCSVKPPEFYICVCVCVLTCLTLSISLLFLSPIGNAALEFWSGRPVL